MVLKAELEKHKEDLENRIERIYRLEASIAKVVEVAEEML